MAKVSKESIEALLELHEHDMKQMMKVVKRLENMGLAHYADHAISCLSKSELQLNKI